MAPLAFLPDLASHLLVGSYPGFDLVGEGRVELDGQPHLFERQPGVVGYPPQPLLALAGGPADCPDDLPDVGPARQPRSPSGRAGSVDDAREPACLQPLVEQPGDEGSGRSTARRSLGVEATEQLLR